MEKEYGIRFKSTLTNKWVWHRNSDGTIRTFTKERAEYLIGEYWTKDVSKVQKITARSK